MSCGRLVKERGKRLRSQETSKEPPLTFCRSEPSESCYVLDKLLGKGAFGSVHLAVNKNTGRRVAIKSIDLRRVFDTSALAREVRIMMLLQPTDSCLKLLDGPLNAAIGTAVHLVLELCEGGQLLERVNELSAISGDQMPATVKQPERGMASFNEADAQCLARQMLSATAHCHGKGIVHCDIKPPNWVFRERKSMHRGSPGVSFSLQDTLVLIDFGLSAELALHHEDGSSSTNRCGSNQNRNSDSKGGRKQKLTSVSGTFSYMAPEVFTGQYDHAADLWAVGVCLFTLLTGEAPYTVDKAHMFHPNKGCRAEAVPMFEGPTCIRTRLHALGFGSQCQNLVAALLSRDVYQVPTRKKGYFVR